MRNVQSLAPLGIAICIALSLPIMVHAQTANAHTAKQPSSRRGTTSRRKQQHAKSSPNVHTLGTVVVTANKRLQNIQKVPMSVSAINGAHLERIHATDFEDYLKQVPGVNVTSEGPGFTQIVMRGITAGSLQQNSTVGIYIDNAPYGSSTTFAEGGLLTPDINPADLERVEVLRGPQGTLYGSNTLGGLIKFVTTPPDTRSFYGNVSLGGTSLVPDGGSGFTSRAMVNVPIVTGTLALRASEFKRQRPGYITNLTSGQKNANKAALWGGRVQLLWTPNSRFSLRLSALTQSLHGSDLSNLGNGFATNGVDINPYTLKPLYGQFNSKHPIGTGPLRERIGMYYANIDANFGWAKLVSTTSYNTERFHMFSDLTFLTGQLTNPLIGLPADTPQALDMGIRLEKKTQEIRLQSPSNQTLEWRVGVFYTHELAHNDQTIFSLDKDTGKQISSPFAVFYFRAQPDTFIERAVYGDVTWHVTKRFSILLGGRATWDHIHYVQSGNKGVLNAGLPSVISEFEDDHPRTFTINPSYQLTNNLMVYARVASGFQPGGPNEGVPPTVQAPKTFGPDKLTSYSLGFKSTLLQDRMHLNADAFYVNWKDIQLSTIKGGFNFVGNVGSASSDGLEASLKYRIISGLTASVAASWTDAKLTRDTPTGLFGLKGMRLPYVPRWNANAGINYVFAIGGGWAGDVGGDVTYTGARKTDFQSSIGPRFTLPPYTIVSLHGGVSFGRWAFDGYVKNLTNSHGLIAIQAEGMDTFAAPFSASYVLPRLVGVSVDYSF